MNNDKFEYLLEQLRRHYSPAELVEFLDLGYDVLFSGDLVLSEIEKHMEELFEEIGDEYEN